jgi:hypothetical protein
MYPVGSTVAGPAPAPAPSRRPWPGRRRSIEDAIAAYEAQRRPQTAGVVLANRGGGPERCIEIVEQRAPDGFVDLDAQTIGRALEARSALR